MDKTKQSKIKIGIYYEINNKKDVHCKNTFWHIKKKCENCIR